MNAVFCGSQATKKPPKKKLRSLDVDLSPASLKAGLDRLRLVSATSVVLSCASKKSPPEDANRKAPQEKTQKP